MPAAPNAREGIVGAWKAGNQAVEIQGDGSIVFTDTLKEQSSTGRYQFVDDTHVKVTFADSSTEELKVSVSSKKAHGDPRQRNAFREVRPGEVNVRKNARQT